MENTQFKPPAARLIRLGVGLIFGGAVGWLLELSEPGKGPLLQWHQIVISTLLLGAFVVWAGASAMRRISLIVWSIVALVLIALFAWHRTAHLGGDTFNPIFFNLSFLIYPFLFITHEMVSSADQSGKVIAPYPLYFDEAWKRGVQLALALLFTGLLWAILWLGAALLGFIGFTWLKSLLSNVYTAMPISGVAMAAAINLGDVQPKLMHNFRALVLGVLSWLLPVITLIGVVFAVSLCFSGLTPLWNTKAATASLLAACVALVLLINAAYQQGETETPVHIVLRWSARLACGLLLIFAGLAAYSLYLRIAQYGLTPERVMALVGVTVACLYGLGYAMAAALPRGRWLRLIEPVNIALAIVMALIFLITLTPLGDPNRLSAQSQAERVNSSKITPEKFDWKVLRFETDSYGVDALKRLKQTGKTASIRNAAAMALALEDIDRHDVDTIFPNQQKFSPDRLKLVYPASGEIPATFLSQEFDLNIGNLPSCLQNKTEMVICNVAIIDLNRDAVPEIVLQNGNQLAVFHHIIPKDKTSAIWVDIDIPYNRSLDDAAIAAFAKGQIKAAPSEWDDLQIGETRIPVRDRSGGKTAP